MTVFEYHLKKILVEASHRGECTNFDFGIIEFLMFSMGILLFLGMAFFIIYITNKSVNLSKRLCIGISLFVLVCWSIYYYSSAKRYKIFKETVVQELRDNTKSYNTSIRRIDKTLPQNIKVSHPPRQGTKYYLDNQYTYYIRLGSNPNGQFVFNRELASFYPYINTFRDGDSVKVEEISFEGKIYLLSLTPI